MTERLQPDSRFIKGVALGTIAGLVGEKVVHLVKNQEAREVVMQKTLRGMDLVGNMFDTTLAHHLPFDTSEWVKQESDAPDSVHLFDPKKHKGGEWFTRGMASLELVNEEKTDAIYSGIAQGKKLLLEGNHMTDLDHTSLEWTFRLAGHDAIADRLVFFAGTKIKREKVMGWTIDVGNTIDILQPRDMHLYSPEQRRQMWQETEEGLEWLWGNGYIPVLYPEATRSKGALLPFSSGSLKILQKADEIFPFGINGTQYIWPRESKLIKPRAHPVTITMGESFRPTNLPDRRLKTLLTAAGVAVAQTLPENMRGAYKDLAV